MDKTYWSSDLKAEWDRYSNEIYNKKQEISWLKDKLDRAEADLKMASRNRSECIANVPCGGCGFPHHCCECYG